MAYIKFEKDADGWIDAEKYKPKNFELVKMMDNFEKIQSGWWNGYHWEHGIKKCSGDIKKWKYFRLGMIQKW